MKIRKYLSSPTYSWTLCFTAPVSFSGRRHQFIDSHDLKTLAESRSTFTEHSFSANFAGDMSSSDTSDRREHFLSEYLRCLATASTEMLQYCIHLDLYLKKGDLDLYKLDFSSIKCQMKCLQV